MTTGLTYSTYVTQIATMAVINSYDLTDPTDPFTIIVPEMINYAELRMQRDIDFLKHGQHADIYRNLWDKHRIAWVFLSFCYGAEYCGCRSDLWLHLPTDANHQRMDVERIPGRLQPIFAAVFCAV